MNRPALKWLHGIERDRVASHLDLACRTHRDLAHRVLPALSVPLDVDDDPLAFRKVPADHHIRHRLQRAERLASPTDQRTEIATTDVECDRLSAGSHIHLFPNALMLQQAPYHSPLALSFPFFPPRSDSPHLS